jgi:hypothetical protein
VLDGLGSSSGKEGVVCRLGVLSTGLIALRHTSNRNNAKEFQS